MERMYRLRRGALAVLTLWQEEIPGDLKRNVTVTFTQMQRTPATLEVVLQCHPHYVRRLYMGDVSAREARSLITEMDALQKKNGQ